MRLITLEEPLDLSDPVATVGQFDGVHVGHASVLETVRSEAEARGGTSVAVTFDPHPRIVIDSQNAPGILTSLEEKRWRIEPLGVDALAVVPFTRALRGLSPEAFVEAYLVRHLRIRAVVMGYDHGFGKDRSGGLETMQALGRKHRFDVLTVPPILVNGEPVSSTRIRRLVSEGDMEGVSGFLGGGYPLIGRVVRGEGRGRELGFPTANLGLEETAKLMPPDGVYAAWVYLPERHGAVFNLGYRPTFKGKSRSLEVHLFDFEGDLYGKTLRLAMCRRLRAERRFENRRALTEQIQRDLDAARQALSQTDGTL